MTSFKQRTVLLSVTASLAAALLTGCGLQQGADTTAPATAALSGVKGSVFGGQSPIVGASVQLYAAGTTGTYGTNSVALVPGSGVTTNSAGLFSFTGQYTCTAGTEVYAVATGGNPGAGQNTAAVLMAVLGVCPSSGSLAANVPFLNINEVTTVGAVYALAPFMSGTTVGAPASNVAGLTAAFADAAVLVNVATGISPGPGAPANAAVPSSEIYTIANILAACINTAGPTGNGSACDKLFQYATYGSSVPSDTIAAALNIARYPSNNVSNLVAVAGSYPPFSPTLATLPDFTLGVTYTDTALRAPSALAVDTSGNIWAANSGNNTVTELSHSGASLSGTGYTAASLNAPSAIAIDTTGNAWVANGGGASVTELSTTGSNLSGATGFTGGGLAQPNSIAFDGQGNVWLSNRGNGSVTELSSTGAAVSGASGYTASGVTPVAVAINPR